MSEDQEQSDYHQQPAQEKDRAIAVVHHRLNSGLKRGIARDGGAIACGKFCKINCTTYFCKKLTTL